MKIETYISSLIIADRRRMFSPHKYYPRSERQYHTFRDRIIRMDEDKNKVIAIMEKIVNRQSREMSDLRPRVKHWSAVIKNIAQEMNDDHRR